MIVFRYSKSSKYRSTSVIPECSIEIIVKYCLIVLCSFTDISNYLVNAAPFLSSDLQRMDQSISSIILKRYSCNDLGYTIFDFSRFALIESIEIGDDSFKSVKTFQIDGLNRLKTIKVGDFSFTQVKPEWFNRYYNHEEWNSMLNKQSKSFHILNCESLESIQIGEYSFSDYAGEFELKNLPQLQSIQIGTIKKDTYNFRHSSFVIRGIELIWHI